MVNEFEGANPETCRHRVIGVSVTEYHDYARAELICTSCHTPPPPEHWVGKNYEYDIGNNVWVQVGPSRRISMREQAERRAEIDKSNDRALANIIHESRRILEEEADNRSLRFLQEIDRRWAERFGIKPKPEDDCDANGCGVCGSGVERPQAPASSDE